MKLRATYCNDTVLSYTWYGTTSCAPCTIQVQSIPLLLTSNRFLDVWPQFHNYNALATIQMQERSLVKITHEVSESIPRFQVLSRRAQISCSSDWFSRLIATKEHNNNSELWHLGNAVAVQRAQTVVCRRGNLLPSFPSDSLRYFLELAAQRRAASKGDIDVTGSEF